MTSYNKNSRQSLRQTHDRACDKLETHYQNAKALIDKLSQSVLAKAFRSELVPQDPNDVPAEKLLERIMEEKIGQLFGVQRPAITKHLKNIFKSRGLVEGSVSSILEHTADDGKNYKTKFYNLDAIISVGYRMNSAQATHFRIWAVAVARVQRVLVDVMKKTDEWKEYALPIKTNNAKRPAFQEGFARVIPDWKSL